MGLSFRRSFRIGKNTRINVSEHGGIGISTGFKGLRISRNKRGTRVTLGGDGVLYTKYLGKKKKKRNKDKKAIKQESIKEEYIIDPENDFEKIPTDNEEILLTMLGNKEINYILYFLLISLIGLLITTYIKQNVLFYSLSGLNLILLIIYIFKSKIHRLKSNFNRSIKLFNKDIYDKSYKLLSRCLKIDSNNPKALMLMIFTTFKLENHEEALMHISNFKKDNETIEVIDFIEGYSCSVTERYEQGLKAIEKVYSNDEEVQNSKYKILGDCYVGLGEYDRAINWYNKLPVRKKDIDDTLAEYKYALGKACFLDGNKKRAFSYLSQVYDYKADYKDVKQLLNSLY